MNPVHRQQVRAHACAPPCLNLHALGEQWIGEVSDVNIVQSPQEDSHEGDQLIFKAHIRGWETDVCDDTEFVTLGDRTVVSRSSR